MALRVPHRRRCLFLLGYLSRSLPSKLTSVIPRLLARRKGVDDRKNEEESDWY